MKDYKSQKWSIIFQCVFVAFEWAFYIFRRSCSSSCKNLNLPTGCSAPKQRFRKQTTRLLSTHWPKSLLTLGWLKVTEQACISGSYTTCISCFVHRGPSFAGFFSPSWLIRLNCLYCVWIRQHCVASRIIRSLSFLTSHFILRSTWNAVDKGAGLELFIVQYNKSAEFNMGSVLRAGSGSQSRSPPGGNINQPSDSEWWIYWEIRLFRQTRQAQIYRALWQKFERRNILRNLPPSSLEQTVLVDS